MIPLRASAPNKWLYGGILVTEPWSGKVAIKSYRAEPIGTSGGAHGGDWIYDASIVCIESKERVSTRSSSSTSSTFAGNPEGFVP